MKVKFLIALTVFSTFLLQVSSAQQTRAYGDSEYRLGPDDVIEVSVWQEPTLSATMVVRPDGKVSVPLISELAASGKTAVELQGEISKSLGQYVANPTVTVIVKEVNSAKVSVLGEVKTPGVYKIQNRATVLDAVAMSGGFTEYANRKKVMVIRANPAGGEDHIEVNVNDLIKGSSDMFYVMPYDKIYVQ